MELANRFSSNLTKSENFQDMYSFVCNPSNFVVDKELFFFHVRHLKMKEKSINPPLLHKSLLTNGPILHAFDWLFEVTL